MSKYGHCVPLKHPYIAKTIIEIFFKEVVKLHRVLVFIASDHDLLVFSLFWKKMFRLQNT